MKIMKLGKEAKVHLEWIGDVAIVHCFSDPF